MLQTDSRVRRYGGVTLVEVILENDGTGPRRVRIESALDGPVWPPRTQGLPEAEWDDDGEALSVRLAPDERRSFGFASPADPVDPPVRVSSEGATDGGTAVSAREVVQALGDPRPPRDAVPGRGAGPGADGHDRDENGEADGSRAGEGSSAGTGADPGAAADPEPEPDPETGASPGREHERERDGEADGGALPPAIVAWLGDVEGRLERSGDGEAGEGEGEGVPDPAVLWTIADRAASLARRIEAGDGGVGRSAASDRREDRATPGGRSS